MNSNISRKPSRPTGALVDCAPAAGLSSSGPLLGFEKTIISQLRLVFVRIRAKSILPL